MVRLAVVSNIHHAKAEAPFVRTPLNEAPSPPWWLSLSPDFHRQTEPFRLSPRDRLRVGTTAMTDLALRTLGAAAVGTLAVPAGYRPSRLREAAADAPIYAAAVEAGDPALFFRPPPKGVSVRRVRARGPRYVPPAGTCWDLQFQSPYVAANPRERPRYEALRRNRSGHARYWTHDGGPRPTLIAIHGFTADPYWLNEWFFSLPAFYEAGYDVLLMTLPFHGQRRELSAPFSGHGFFAGGINRLNEAFGQAICDLRVLVDFLLEERGAPQVGVTGVSLGGYTAALAATVEPRLAFAVPNVPVASLVDLVLEWHPVSALVHSLVAVTGWSIGQLRELLAVHSPLTWRPVIDQERLMVIGGVADRFAPPKHTRLLWEHWDRCRLHWFPGSHLIHLDRGAYQLEVNRFLADIGFTVR
ncbi:MAG: alpha/beta fold hydrolase [Deltaproteobacteria bacterium]|nr:alpha/beta fold hydrolase [Deltaproteobacteria bacterium]MCB9786660.1 alpha/beta fold hydrolase [Deltaproteobacteria bacterium]